MLETIRGKTFKVGDDINTDYILPARYLDLFEPEDLGPHAFEGLGEEYADKLPGHNVVVGGENFGLGSAREQAPNALKGAGIQVILAKSFARIFYRNALNVGLVVIESNEAAEAIGHEEEVVIHLKEGIITTGEKRFFFKVYPDVVMEILDAGGMVHYLKKKLKLEDKKKGGHG
jgi:3-isopropylmalate/(R)-2-methylmalate dehydratase small subunit